MNAIKKYFKKRLVLKTLCPGCEEKKPNVEFKTSLCGMPGDVLVCEDCYNEICEQEEEEDKESDEEAEEEEAEEEAEAEEEEIYCDGKHCINTKNLKNGMGWNSHYIWDNEELPQFENKLFCPDCYEECTHTNCYYCKKTMPNGQDVKLSISKEICCIECDVSLCCCPNGHYGGQYGCDFCPPSNHRESQELSSLLEENKEIFNGVYCPIKHYKICHYSSSQSG
jgi:hypothetical protein